MANEIQEPDVRTTLLSRVKARCGTLEIDIPGTDPYYYKDTVVRLNGVDMTKDLFRIVLVVQVDEAPRVELSYHPMGKREQLRQKDGGG